MNIYFGNVWILNHLSKSTVNYIEIFIHYKKAVKSSYTSTPPVKNDSPTRRYVSMYVQDNLENYSIDFGRISIAT